MHVCTFPWPIFRTENMQKIGNDSHFQRPCYDEEINTACICMQGVRR
uniref:Uncharacterized protein n=1 Tax=Arundo donax TaxID=35708 RepID=A0A0A8YNT4_ARUDO